MADTDRPQLYLVTPAAFDPQPFGERLAPILDSVEVACLRIALATRDEDDLGRAADALRALAHERDVAVVIDSHPKLAERHGLDGVHLLDAARSIREARRQLGPDAIVGAFCGASRHDGMTAGEAGADYVSFGPVGDTLLGTRPRAEFDLFEWWSQMIEVPVVAEGALTPELVERFAPVTDFVAIGDEIWRAPDPLSALQALLAPIG